MKRRTCIPLRMRKFVICNNGVLLVYSIRLYLVLMLFPGFALALHIAVEKLVWITNIPPANIKLFNRKYLHFSHNLDEHTHTHTQTRWTKNQKHPEDETNIHNINEIHSVFGAYHQFYYFLKKLETVMRMCFYRKLFVNLVHRLTKHSSHLHKSQVGRKHLFQPIPSCARLIDQCLVSNNFSYIEHPTDDKIRGDLAIKISIFWCMYVCICVCYPQ